MKVLQYVSGLCVRLFPLFKVGQALKKQATLPSLTKTFIASHLSGGVNCLSNVIEVKMFKHTSAIDVKLE